MQIVSASQLALMAMMRFHGFGGRRGGFEIFLLLGGLVFAGVLVWVIERSGRPKIYR